MLSKSRNSLLDKRKYNIVAEIFRDDFNTFSIEAQVTLLPKFIKRSGLLSLSDLINAFIAGAWPAFKTSTSKFHKNF